MFRILATVLLLLSVTLTACSSFISATSDGPIEDPPGERSLGAAIDDQIIETKALVNIRAAAQELENANINVVSYNGIVLLTGQVPSEQARQQAASTAANIKRVRRVHNELTVSGKTSMLVRSNDSWITTKVKSRLALEESIDSSNIKVVTENGVVFLMGIVNQQVADATAEIVRQTGGVQKVVRVFEYY